MIFDSDHAGYKATQCPQNVFMTYVNMALINWLSKKQPTIESSVFGSEFVAMDTGMSALCGIIHKFLIVGMSLTGPSYIYGDNMSVIKNTQKPESTPKKKNNSIFYHAMRESIVMGELITSHIPTNSNLYDMLTNTSFGKNNRGMVEGLLYDFFD